MKDMEGLQAFQEPSGEIDFPKLLESTNGKVPVYLDPLREAWRVRSHDLATWAMDRMAVRRDTYGWYDPGGRSIRRLDQTLIWGHLVAHFEGDETLALYVIDPEDNRCLQGAVGIDYHDKEGQDPDLNWKAALRAVEKFADYGVTGHIFDSNGRGGFQVRVFFNTRVESRVVHGLCECVHTVLEYEGFGKHKYFPKQKALKGQDSYGSLLRVPGRHPKWKSHWTRVWDSTNHQWLEGAECVEYILAITGDDPARVIAAGSDHPKNQIQDEDEDEDGVEILETPDEKRVRSALAALPDEHADDRDKWFKVGLALKSWDAVKGLELFDEFSQRCPGKYNKEQCQKDFDGFKVIDDGITIGSLFHEALKSGWKFSDADDRTEVVITPDEHVVRDKVLAALSDHPDLYRRGDHLFEVHRQTEDRIEVNQIIIKGGAGSPVMSRLSSSNLRAALTSVVRFVKYEEGKDSARKKHVHPPGWLTSQVDSRENYPGVRSLLSVVECPFIRADGTIVETPGYDPASGTLLVNRGEKFLPVPDAPTQEDAKAAAARILEVVSQAAFASDLDRAAWLAGLLLPMARGAIDQPVPGHALNGNRRGVGKGLLIDVIGIINTGRNVPTSNYPLTKEESVKTKVAFLLAGSPLLHFDNLEEGSFYGNSAFDSALTSTTMNERILGASKLTGEMEWRTICYLSGNGLSPWKDADRRWLVINLVTDLEHPEEKEFKIKDLRGHVKEHRAELVRDVLTILRAHYIAGQPNGGWTWQLGSYTAWDRWVRGAVWYATGWDCYLTLREAGDEAPDRSRQVALLEGWLELPEGETGITVTEVVKRVVAAPEQYPTLLNALVEYGSKGYSADTSKMGQVVKGMNNNVIDGMRFVKVMRPDGKPKLLHGVAVWKVEIVSQKKREEWDQRHQEPKAPEPVASVCPASDEEMNDLFEPTGDFLDDLEGVTNQI